MGATTPLGGDVASTWEALLAGRSGVRRIDDDEHDWVDRYDLPVKIAAPLAVEPTEVHPARPGAAAGPLRAGGDRRRPEAWAHAGLGEPGSRWSPSGSPSSSAPASAARSPCSTRTTCWRPVGLRKVSPLTVPMLMPNGPAAWVGLEFGRQGGVHAPGLGVRVRRRGARLGAAAAAQRARSTSSSPAAPRPASPASPSPGSCRPARCPSATTSRSGRRGPFDVDRDGFVLGEGAGVMVLERAEFAAARGATVHGRLAGVGLTVRRVPHHRPRPGGHRPVPGHPQGGRDGRAVADRRRARQLPRDVHRRRRRRRDAGGPQGARRPLGAHRAEVGARSPGRCGAGAVESIITLLSIKEGIIPATLNLDEPRPGVELDVVAGEPRKVDLQAAVCDSFGFGGHNVAAGVHEGLTRSVQLLQESHLPATDRREGGFPAVPAGSAGLRQRAAAAGHADPAGRADERQAARPADPARPQLLRRVLRVLLADEPEPHDEIVRPVRPC